MTTTATNSFFAPFSKTSEQQQQQHALEAAAARARALKGQLPNPKQLPFQINGRYIPHYKCYECFAGNATPARAITNGMDGKLLITQGEILTTATFPIGEGVDQYTNQPTITQREFIFQGGFDCSHQGHQDICTETDVPYSYPWADNHATAKSYLCNPCSFHFRQCVVCLKALAVRCPYHVEHPVSGFSAEGRLKILSCDGCKLLVVKHKRITEAVTRVIMCRVKGEAILTPTHRGASSYGPVRAPTLSSRQTRSRRAAASATTAAAVRHSTSASSSPISSPSNTPTSHATRRTRSSTAASKKKASVTFNEEEI